MKTLKPDLRKIQFNYKGREIEIPYHYPKWPVPHIFILDRSGKEHVLYKGLYNPGEWYAKCCDSWDPDFTKLLSAEIDKLTPYEDDSNTGKQVWEQKLWWEL